MDYINKQIILSKDYQLKSLIEQFTRFQDEVTCNITDLVLRHSIGCAREELDKRDRINELEQAYSETNSELEQS